MYACFQMNSQLYLKSSGNSGMKITAQHFTPGKVAGFPCLLCSLSLVYPKETQTPIQITTLNWDLQKGRDPEQCGNWVATTDLNRKSLACFPLIQETRVKFILSNFDDRRTYYSYFLIGTYFSRRQGITSFVGQRWNWYTKKIQWTILMESKYKIILTSDTYVIISICIDISVKKFENLINKSKEVKSLNSQCTYNC